MNIDDAKQVWQDELSNDSIDYAALVAKVRTAERFGSKLFHRDLIETAAAIFVVAMFIPELFRIKEWPSWLGIWVIILGAVEIVVVMHWMRIRVGKTPLDASLKEFFQRERQRVDTQIWLLRNIAWWYCAPCLIGFCMFFVGLILPFVTTAVLACVFEAWHDKKNIHQEDHAGLNRAGRISRSASAGPCCAGATYSNISIFKRANHSFCPAMP